MGNQKLKILYVTTISNTINAFLVPHIEFLVKQGHQVDIACHIVQEVNPKLDVLGCTVYDIEFDRSPLKLQNISAYKRLKRLISDQKYDIVHTHTPVASACVRLACRKMKNVKVIYTAHGFHFFKGAPLINWLTYYPVERWLARYTDVLITINKEDYLRSESQFKAHMIRYIPGVGVRLDRFREIELDRDQKRKELGIPEGAFLVLSVGELNKNKNHELIIKALFHINKPDIYYLICGEGNLGDYLNDLTKELGLQDKVIFLGFQSNMPEIYKLVDLFAFPSKREGLPVSLMEAMASGLPVVCSNIRGNVDLAENSDNICIVSSNDLKGFSRSIEFFYNQYKLKNRANVEYQISKYSLENVLSELRIIYDEITNTPDKKVDKI